MPITGGGGSYSTFTCCAGEATRLVRAPDERYGMALEEASLPSRSEQRLV